MNILDIVQSELLCEMFPQGLRNISLVSCGFVASEHASVRVRSSVKPNVKKILARQKGDYAEIFLRCCTDNIGGIVYGGVSSGLSSSEHTSKTQFVEFDERFDCVEVEILLENVVVFECENFLFNSVNEVEKCKFSFLKNIKNGLTEILFCGENGAFVSIVAKQVSVGSIVAYETKEHDLYVL